MHRSDSELANKPVGWVKLADCWYPCLVKGSIKSKQIKILFLNENGKIGGGGSCDQDSFALELPPGEVPAIPMPNLFPAPIDDDRWVSILQPSKEFDRYRVKIGRTTIEAHDLHQLIRLLKIAASRIG